MIKYTRQYDYWQIKVLGYITNTIENTSSTEYIPIFTQIGVGINEVMLSFFTQQASFIRLLFTTNKK